MSESSSSFDPFQVRLGWDEFFQSSFDQVESAGCLAGRLVGQGKGHYHIQVTAQETKEAAITGRFHDAIQNSTDFPTVGDWVAFTPAQGNKHASIHRVLKRKSSLQRIRNRAKNDMQLIAANVDFMLVVTSCNEDFDLPRIGRFVALAKDSGCTAALLLTKVDLCKNPDDYRAQLKSQFLGLELFAISSHDLQSMDQLQKFFATGKTTVLLGSSGVGKSTFTNYLLGSESQKTQAVSAESRGRHTTTARNLCFTRWGGLVMDTPGMQEVLEAADEDEFQKNFSDIEELMLRCKFTTCQHKNEPGCAVQTGLKSGTLTLDRWNECGKKEAEHSRRSAKKRSR